MSSTLISPTEHDPIPEKPRADRSQKLMQPDVLVRAAGDSLRKLNPATLIKNPVMFIVEIGAILTSVILLADILGVADSLGASIPAGDRWFVAWITAWLWFTVYFANLAEAIAEGRGKAQADAMRRTRKETIAKVMVGDSIEERASADLKLGDLVRVDAGETIPGDGEVVAGVAFVSEAAITGESAPVLKESGSDVASSVTGGTEVVSDSLTIRITAEPGKTFLDRMIALVEGASRQKTPNEIALNILLAGLTIIFLIVVITLAPMAAYADATVSITVLVALLVTLIPTTIGALLSAIGIAGMDRMVQQNVLAMSGRAVEAAGDVDVLLLDKTGTITFGNRMAHEFFPAPDIQMESLIKAAAMSSLADETPEGKSIVLLASRSGVQGLALPAGAELIPFTASTRVSGVQIGERRVMKGSIDAIERIVGALPQKLIEDARHISEQGGTPLAVADDQTPLGVIYLKDTVKPGLREQFDELRRMGIRTIMITGDNPLTARSIAAEAGIDDYVAEATPEDKIRVIREQQAEGRLVAMTGDGTNDAPALAQADVGLAMNTGTAAAKEAGNMVDLDSNPTKLIAAVAIGKQLLMTRGALTTFSIANDVAKYFAIIPAIFAVAYGADGLGFMNVMRLASPESAILSAVIFNALIIVALIPLALRGVTYRPMPAADLLRRNILIYGFGGLIAPFLGIKLIDATLVFFGLS